MARVTIKVKHTHRLTHTSKNCRPNYRTIPLSYTYATPPLPLIYLLTNTHTLSLTPSLPLPPLPPPSLPFSLSLSLTLSLHTALYHIPSLKIVLLHKKDEWIKNLY